MASPLSQAGAITSQSKSAPLHTNRFFTGMWTQRSPLRDAATTYLYEKFYTASRFDSILGGLNCELTSRLTLARRRGSSVYNSQTFPAINRFYEFRTFSGTEEIIRVMVDTAGFVYDATGPNTKALIWTKGAGSGSSYFQSVGNTLYFGNGKEQKKWLQSALSWAAATTFKSGNFIVDTNENLQVAMGARSANITSVQQVNATNTCTITFQGKIALLFFVGMRVTLTGLTVATWLNGQTVTITAVTYNQIVFTFVHANSGPLGDTGTAACAGGNTGGSQPVWGTTIGAVTADGSEQWLCKGSSVQNWGIAAPTVSPTAVNSPRPSAFNRWTANTYYSSSISIIDGGFIFRVTTGGVTGGGAPAFVHTPGVTTADGSVVWTCISSASWIATHAFVVGDQIQVTWTYWVTIPDPTPPCFSPNVPVLTPDGPMEFGKMPPALEVMTECGPMMADLLSHEFDGEMIDMGDGKLVTLDHRFKRGDEYVRAEEAFAGFPRVPFKGLVYNLAVRTTKEEQRHYILESGEVAHNRKADPDPSDPPPSDSYEVTATAVWLCTTAGNTAGSQPGWVDALGASVSDGTVVWQNTGAGATWASIGATQAVSLDQIVLDVNGNKQQISITGKSSAVEPTWATTIGQTTIDNTASWVNAGQFSSANTKAWSYAFSPKNSLSGEVATASPSSLQVVLAANKVIAVQGPGSDDTQADVIQIFRTLLDGSTLLLLDEIPAPAPGQLWTYFDSSLDSALSTITTAPDVHSNDPAPEGAIAPSYHLRRIWVAVGNTLYFSGGPDTLNGNGNSTFPPLNSFVFPSKIIRTWPTSIGLIVFTVSDAYIILGKGTSNEPFYPSDYLNGVGLLSYDAFTVHGSTAHLMTTSNKVISLDPGAGILEEGFPIGDQFDSLYNPATTYVTWHEGKSGETAMYVADGVGSWFRMSPVSAPESGFVWSPQATIAAGCKAVQSIETSPGTTKLLIGPGATPGPILFRDTTVNRDNSVPFAANVIIGSITLAQPGQIADLEFITLDSIKTGTRAKVAILLGEISGRFENVRRTKQDPPLLPPSKTLYNDRYMTSQTQTPTLCRHFQLQISWAAEDAHNELLSYTIYGALHQEKRIQ